MKKNLLVITVIFVFLFALKTKAGDMYYWDNFMDTAAIYNEAAGGEVRFVVMPYEYDSGEKVDNGLDVNLGLDLALFKNMELYGTFFSQGDYLNAISELKLRFFHNDQMALSVMGRVFHVRNDFTTYSIKALFDKKLNDKIMLHNNVQLYFYESGIIGKRLESGVTYYLDSKNAIKMRLKTFFIDSYKEGLLDFRLAYRHILNNQVIYYFYSYYDINNAHLENIVEYRPIKPLSIEAHLIINTGELQLPEEFRHWAGVRVGYTVNQQVTLFGEYRKEAVKSGYNYLKFGIDLNI